jgi:hypothetical protein
VIGLRPHQRRTTDARSGPSWLRYGFLVAVGEAIVLALVVFHAGGALGANSADGDHRASSGGHISGAAHHAASPREAPTTTIPASPPDTELTSGTTPTIPPAPPSAIAPPATPVPSVTAAGTLAANIAPQPNFLQSCSGSQYDDSLSCVAATLQAISNGRSHEGLPPMVLPRNWSQLTPGQQIFVATNLERTARGMAPLTAMATTLDEAALQGAGLDIDPGPPGGFPYSQWGSNWAGAVGNPLEAMYFWMYDDGPSSANIDCTATNRSGCWGHRENILLRLPCRLCLMGTAWDATAYQSVPSMTELLVETSGTPALDFTWQQESTYLP